MIDIVSPPNGDLPPPFGLFFPVFFVGLWLFISFIISRVGGWNTLACYYRAQQPFLGTLIRFQAASLRAGTNYNGCLNVGANAEGLYIAPMAIFRAFHPPLLISWSDITARPIKLWIFFNFIELRFQRAPNIPFRIKPSLAAKLAEASVGRLSVIPPDPVRI